MSNFISLARAISMTENYRDNMESILSPGYKDKGILPICETFDRASFETLLEETDAAFIRVYLGMDKDLKIRIIAVAADSANQDILPAGNSSNTAFSKNFADDGGNIVEDGIRCPDTCPPPSPLNP